MLKTVYIFSTRWANEAAESVLTGRCSNIVEYHQKQPKGPGYHRHPRKRDDARKSVTEAKKSPEKEPEPEPEEREEEAKEVTPPRGSKRRSVRTSVSADGQTPQVKKRRSSTQQQRKSPPPKVPSPPPFLRSSRRLRRQRNQSPVAPSPPPAATTPEKEKTRSPSPAPPPPPAPRPSSAPKGRPTRTSRRLAKARQKNDSSFEGAPEKASSVDNESPEPSPKRNKIDDQEKEGETVGQGEEQEATGVAVVSQISPGESTHGDNDQPSVPSTTLEEDNYTICHGTPHANSPRADMSSPKAWQQQQQLLQQQQQQRNAAQHLAPVDPTNQIQLAHSNPTLSQQGSERVFSPPQGGGIGANRSGSQAMEHQRRSSTGHMQHDSGGSGGHTPTEPHPSPRPSPHQSPHPMPATDYYHGAGIPAHYHGMPGGYPGMYNPAIPGLPYPAPPGQPIPGANYPYAMPYAWGHHAAQLGAHGDHMQSDSQRSGETIQRQGRSGAGEGQGFAHGRPQLMQPGTAMFKNQAGGFTSVPVSSPPGGMATHQEKLPPQSSSSQQHQHHPPPTAAGHQLGNAAHSIPHQLSHAMSRPTAHSVGPEQLPHPSFPYSFDAGSHPSLHMWQQSQMQAQQMRPIPGMHPAHLAPSMTPHGLWYSSTGHPHLVPGQELLVKKAGGKAKGGKSAGAASRNSNNSNNKVTSAGDTGSARQAADLAYSRLAANQLPRNFLGAWGGGGGGHAHSKPPENRAPRSYVPLVPSVTPVPPSASTSEHASNQPTPYDW